MRKSLSIFCVLFVSLITAQAQYCIPDPGSNGCFGGDNIDNFALFGESGTFIVNIGSGCSPNAYADLTAQSISLSQGIAYTATVSTQYVPDDNVAIWIDFNDDFAFDNTELVATALNISLGGTPVAIAIPGTAPLGNHRMRVSLRFEILPQDMNPCNTGILQVEASDFGEAHDYTVNIVAPPTCPPPTNLVVSGMTQNSVTLNWNGSAPEYGIEYGPAGFIPGTGTYITSLTNSITINALTTSMNYTAYVRSLCSNTDSSASAPSINFATACPAQNLPYSQNFDGVTIPDIPVCMTVEDANGNGNTWFTGNFISQSAPNALFYESDNMVDADEWIFTPGLNVTAGTTYQVSFSYITGGVGTESLEVKAGNGASSTSMGVTPYFINTNLQNTTFQTSSFNYTAATTGVIYFGWHLFTFANMNGLAIDDISITATTTSNCDTSLTLTATSVTASNATLTWSAVTGASGYQYVLDQTAAVPTGAGTPTSLTTHNASGLIPNTTYYFHVRTACGTNFSSWKTVSFTTSPVNVVDVNAGNTGVQVYPNPVRDVAIVELSDTASNAEVQLIDITGKVLQTLSVTGKKAEVDMSKVAPGIYMIRYRDDGNQELIKVVKQ